MKIGKIKAKLSTSAIITRADGTVEDLGVINHRDLTTAEILKLLWTGFKNKVRKIKHG